MWGFGTWGRGFSEGMTCVCTDGVARRSSTSSADPGAHPPAMMTCGGRGNSTSRIPLSLEWGGGEAEEGRCLVKSDSHRKHLALIEIAKVFGNEYKGVYNFGICLLLTLWAPRSGIGYEMTFAQ